MLHCKACLQLLQFRLLGLLLRVIQDKLETCKNVDQSKERKGAILADSVVFVEDCDVEDPLEESSQWHQLLQSGGFLELECLEANRLRVYRNGGTSECPNP